MLWELKTNHGTAEIINNSCYIGISNFLALHKETFQSIEDGNVV